MKKVTIKDVRKLYKPPKDSHKGQNGKLLIIGGSKLYHGSPIFAVKVASRIIDLVYFSSVKEVNTLVEKMKFEIADVIVIPKSEVNEYAKKVDCILIGGGMEQTKETKRLTENLLKRFPEKKFVIDADSLKVMNPKLLNENCIVTPHSVEFKKLFKVEANEENARKMAKEYRCIVVLKGRKDIICSPKVCKYNLTGNVGMTKGGTGDTLAGLIAALACKNDLFLAATVGTFVNGLSGDRLKEKVGYYYNASDLVEEIPKAMKWCRNHTKN